MLTLISNKRRMFPMAAGPMHGGLERAAAARMRRPRRALLPDEALLDLCRSSTRASNALARHLAGTGSVPAAGWRVMMANRVEFIIAVHAVSKLGAAAVL